ncbi:MAG: hypothetical protein GVY12_03670 [Bacteroidetes bacterium]|jgi:hypothetical protein|nr:hypothetical protein [Bacteroidota bacterium]
MTLRFSVLLITCAVTSCLLVSAAVAQVQSTGSPTQTLMSGESASERHLPVASSALTAPPGSAGWERRYHPNHALGRAYLSTLVPMALGTALTGFSEGNATAGVSPFRSPLYVAGLCLGALGIAVGPSMGLWCTGDSQTAWLSAGLRTAGLGAIGAGFWRASAALDEGEGLGILVAAPLLITLYALPGLLITSAGIGWAFNATPNRWCAGTPQAQATLQPQVDGTGQGLALRVQW